MTKHSIGVPLTVIDSTDDGNGEIEVTFGWLPGAPETGPSYASGGEPADPDEFEVFSVAYRVGKTLFPTALSPDEEDLVIDWLNDHWDRPEPDEPDYYTEAKDRRLEEEN